MENVLSSFDAVVVCAIDETILCLSLSVCQTALKSLFWVPTCVPGLSIRHDWPVKKAIVDLPIRMKGNWKRISGNSSSPLAAQNKDLGAASSQMLLTPEVK